MKVLIVDHDPRALDALTVGLQLQWQDCEVLTASGGDAGEQAFFDHLPDVVLLEPALADRSGYDVLRAIRRVSDVPVLIVSARGAETDHLKVFVSRLRRKLASEGGPSYIETERGLGYRFVRPADLRPVTARVAAPVPLRPPARASAMPVVRDGKRVA